VSEVTHPQTDLADRADVEVLLRRFYGRIFDDATLDEPFAELRVKGLDSHLPVMCDFWETVLFRAGLYHGNALLVHRQLDSQASVVRQPLRPLADTVERHPRRDVPGACR